MEGENGDDISGGSGRSHSIIPPDPRGEVDVPETGTGMHRPPLMLDVPGTETEMPMADHVASLADVSAIWHGNAPRASPPNSLN